MTNAAPPFSVVVGRVLKPHGVRGEVLVEVVSDVAERFEPGATVDLVLPNAGRRALTTVAVRPHRAQLIVRFLGIDDRDAAEGLRGASLEVDGDRVPEPPAGWYFHHQLHGLECHDAEAGSIGVVDDVVEDGGGLLLSLRSDGKSLLVPFVNEYIRDIDLKRGRIDLELPQGLVDLCTSRS